MMPAIFSSFVLKLFFNRSRVIFLLTFNPPEAISCGLLFFRAESFSLGWLCVPGVRKLYVRTLRSETHVRSSAFGTMFENSMFIDWKRVLCNSCPDRGAFKFRSCRSSVRELSCEKQNSCSDHFLLEPKWSRFRLGCVQRAKNGEQHPSD